MLRYQIGITLIKGIGNVLAKNLIAYVGSAEGVFREKKQALARIPGIGEIKASEILNHSVLERADQEVEFITKNKLTTHYFTDANYSYRLKECPDAPIIQYGKGKIELNKGKYLGIVGTRKPTEMGKEYCTQLVKDLAQLNLDITIVSGLAYGIDTIAHKAALDAGLPTIAIPAHGLDRIYPAANRPTAIRMLNNGGILTEFMSETNPDKANFVQRNRIIAGLCDATIVVESPRSGGSLITASMANSYSREVFAFAGRPTDKSFEGCNRLIKHNAAALIDNAEDLVRYMGWEKTASQDLNSGNTLFSELYDDSQLSDTERTIVSALRTHTDGIHTDDLCTLTALPFHQLSSLLLEMEFKGLVRPLPGSIYKMIK